ncbi:MAG: hypothetical protein CMJ88_04790 [Planctomycetes bacterium]|nr:hypothetical protein [Planctomycetota bacterium]|tara:strand:+ start:197 stop:661 length:465 start_codon:yes stop_codon:yes gene_type:complete
MLTGKKSAVRTRYTIEQANEALKLVRVIAAELMERRDTRREMASRRSDLEAAAKPERLRSQLAELDARIWEQDEALLRCRRELDDLGMKVFRDDPLTIHIPGRGLPKLTRRGQVIEPGRELVFCWKEDETGVEFGSNTGDDEQQREPLPVSEGA